MDDQVKILTGPTSPRKESGRRADFRAGEFDLQVAAHGYRVWWSRAAQCPCQNNRQTNQPDIRCPLCRGSGWLYFLPDPALPTHKTDAAGNAVQLNADTPPPFRGPAEAVLIQVHMTSLAKDVQTFERFGEWVLGTSRVTSQAANRLSYRDRLVLVDAVMDFHQLLRADGTATVPVVPRAGMTGLRYPALNVTLLRSLSTVYRSGEDFRCDPDGTIAWLRRTPVKDTVLTIRYEAHPAYLVIGFLAAIRSTMVRQKRGEDKAKQYTPLPLSYMAKLEHLLDSEEG